MPRTPLVAVRAALRSAVKANGEAGHRRSLASEGHGCAKAESRRASRVSRARMARADQRHSRFVT